GVPSVGLLVLPRVSTARVPAATSGGVCMTKVVVLGGSGMLGSMVVDVLSRNPALNVTATVRDATLAAQYGSRLPGAAWRVFWFERDPPPSEMVAGHAWVVNSIGINKAVVRGD